jgi:hypothetical protein
MSSPSADISGTIDAAHLNRVVYPSRAEQPDGEGGLDAPHDRGSARSAAEADPRPLRTAHAEALALTSTYSLTPLPSTGRLCGLAESRSEDVRPRRR